MADKIIQNTFFQLGQSQNERMPKELKGDFIKIDERTTEDFLQFTQNFAQFVNYYRDNISAAVGNWTKFFPKNPDEIKKLLALLAKEEAKPETERQSDTPPHLALFLTFLELYKQPQEVINRITGRHLDFYYQEVLRLKKKSALPDKAHVLIELKKKVLPITITPTDLFSAGKDNTGVELLYVPTHETVVNTAQVVSLRSIFQDNLGIIRQAPIANSADGMGDKLTGDEPKWYGFGHPSLPAAEVGFALASPGLRMKEGLRKVTLTLTLKNIEQKQLSTTSFQGAFELFVTGEKNWLGPYSINSPTLTNNVLQFSFTVPASETAVVNYDAKIHGYSYTTQAPIIQVLLKTELDSTKPAFGYNDFKNIILQKIAIEINVSGITSLKLENDDGALDPKKAFLPFGPQPTVGSRFMVGCEEALSKNLSAVDINIQWKDVPADFGEYYAKYEIKENNKDIINNDYFTTTVNFRDRDSWEYSKSGESLFDSNNASSKRTFTFQRTTYFSVSSRIMKRMQVSALNAAGSRWAAKAATKLMLTKPVLTASTRVTTPEMLEEKFTSSSIVAPEIRDGFITFSLEKDFLHSTYRKKYVENVMIYRRIKDKADKIIPPIILNEPHTPTIKSILLSYTAHSNEVTIASDSLLDDFANPDIQFFHLAYFGQMREHGYQRKQFNFLINKDVFLLPIYEHEGELLIGFDNLKAGDSVSVLFQVAEGSADPDLTQENIVWFVLCDNYWKPLESSKVVLDTTNQLLTSGIIRFAIPTEATTHNTILPSGQIWIKAAIAKKVSAVCQLIEVTANAIEVQFKDSSNDPNHLLTALEQGKITKLKNGLAAIKSVKQPYASFGGKSVEMDEAFYTRVAERLRHKNRCITAWDYERIILEAFPNVHRVKCIPHAKKDSWSAPGHVLIVVVPDLKNKNAFDLLQPKVDSNTLSHIASYVQKRAGMQVQFEVRNPSYQRIKLDFKVKFRSGYEFNFYSNKLNQQIKEFLSPWAFDQQRDIAFGGKVYQSVLLDFVEEIEYVDYVTDFKMYSSNQSGDLNEVFPAEPNTIWVSNQTHTITEAT